MSKKMRRAAMHTHTHTHSKPPTCSNPLSPHSSSACQAALCSGCRTQYADASTHVRNSSYSHFQNTPPLLVQILPLNRSDRICRLSPTALLRLCLCPIISASPCLLGAPVRRTYMLHIHAPPLQPPCIDFMPGVAEAYLIPCLPVPVRPVSYFSSPCNIYRCSSQPLAPQIPSNLTSPVPYYFSSLCFDPRHTCIHLCWVVISLLC